MSILPTGTCFILTFNQLIIIFTGGYLRNTMASGDFGIQRTEYSIPGMETDFTYHQLFWIPFLLIFSWTASYGKGSVDLLALRRVGIPYHITKLQLAEILQEKYPQLEISHFLRGRGMHQKRLAAALKNVFTVLAPHLPPFFSLFISDFSFYS